MRSNLLNASFNVTAFITNAIEGIRPHIRVSGAAEPGAAIHAHKYVRQVALRAKLGTLLRAAGFAQLGCGVRL